MTAHAHPPATAGKGTIRFRQPDDPDTSKPSNGDPHTPGATLPVRIEISHLATDEPTWIQERDGTEITTTRLQDADPDAGDIKDRGGYAFNDEWERVFAKWTPQEVADEIIDLQNGAGFSARLLPQSHHG